MRPGHKCSSSFKKGFESDTYIQVVLKTVEYGKLIDKDSPQCKALGSNETLGGNLSMAIKDALKMLIEILNGERTQLMEDAADLNAIVGICRDCTQGSM